MTDLSRAANAPGATGFVYDDANGILYLTTLSGELLRWDVTGGKFLAPIFMGGSQSTIAVSPDGAFLLVGSASQTMDSGGVLHGEIDRVSIANSSITRLDVPFSTNYPHGSADEHGVYDIAIASNGEAIVTTQGWSGNNPLREFQANTPIVGSRAVTGLPTVSPNSHLTSTADGRFVLVISSEFAIYDAIADSIQIYGNPDVASFHGGSSISDTASLVFYGGEVYDFNLHLLKDLSSTYSISNISGAQFSPDGTKLYILDADHEQVRVFNTSSWSEVKDIQLGAGVLQPGASEEISISHDGRFLFFRTATGFESLDLSSSSSAAPAAPPTSPPTSGPWTPQQPPYPGGFFGTPAKTISGAYTVGSATHITSTAALQFMLTSPLSAPGPTLTINGSLAMSSAASNSTLKATASDYSGDFQGSLIKVGSGGSITVSETGAGSAAYGYSANDFGARVENDGLWSISATSVAYGVARLYTPNAASPNFANHGTFQVSAAFAYGVTAAGEVQFVNDGHFSVTGSTQAIGVELGGGPYSSFVNSGDFQVHGPSGSSVALWVASGYGNVGLPIFNSGTISADAAIQVSINGTPASTGIINLTNSGTINGAINLAPGYLPDWISYPHGAPGSQIVNTGSINGAIHFDNGNVLYDGAGGAQTGGIYLGSGTDRVILGNDGETVYGGSGFEDITGGSGNDTFVAGDGDSTIDGRAGVDRMNFSGVASNYSITPSGSGYTVFGPLGAAVSLQNVEILQFTDRQMVLSSSGQTLTARAGGDVLVGGAGADTLNGQAGADSLTGGAGNDIVNGGAGDDTLNGNGGNDILDGGGGKDTLNGGPGIDTATYYDAPSGVTVNLQLGTAQNTGGAGTDTLVGIENLTGSNFNDTLTAGATGSVLQGLGGGDVLVSGPGADTIDGGTGNDTAVFSGAYASYVVTPGATTTVSGPQGTDTLTNVEILRFSDRQVVLGGAAETLTARAGGDTLVGGGGDDTLVTGTGNDTIDGGAGNDTANFSGAYASYAVGLSSGVVTVTGGGSTYTLTNVESLHFTDQTVLVSSLGGGGGTPGLTLNGTANNDVMTGGAGDDTIHGRAGNDTVSGLGGNDLLYGDTGNDILNGGAGNDTLLGGAGQDSLTGGANNDTFRFLALADSAVSLQDTITDFTSGQDKIDLFAIDPSFHIGASAAAHTIVVSYDAVHDRTVVDLYVTSSLGAEIWLSGNHALAAGDFVL